MPNVEIVSRLLDAKKFVFLRITLMRPILSLILIFLARLNSIAKRISEGIKKTKIKVLIVSIVPNKLCRNSSEMY